MKKKKKFKKTKYKKKVKKNLKKKFRKKISKFKRNSRPKKIKNKKKFKKIKQRKSKKIVINKIKSKISTRNAIIKIIRLGDKFKFNFKFDIDRSLQNFFQGIANKIDGIKQIIEEETSIEDEIMNEIEVKPTPSPNKILFDEGNRIFYSKIDSILINKNLL